MRIGIVAPSCSLDATIPDRLKALAGASLGKAAPEFVVHPQCFLSEGHFAGPDKARIDALVETANDPSIDAIWFARGGYGACRVAEPAIRAMGPAARDKLYLGYSDAGFLLAGLYAHGIGRVAHGPMPADLNRQGGEAAALRGLDWLLDPDAVAIPTQTSSQIHLAPPLTGARDKCAAFNLTVFSQLLGTPLQPDLTDHILMIEEIGEYMYRIDRSLFHVTSNPAVRRVAGIRLGRCSDIPENDPDFVLNEEEIVRHWCAVSGIPWLGRADIGHDAANTVVPFG
jgi:muramoyltetrapeptide carboxypeptidase